MCLQLLLLFPIYFITFISCAQQDSTTKNPQVQQFHYSIGPKTISLTQTRFQPNAFFFIRLHDNETTAETATLNFLKTLGGTMLSVDNARKRYITYFEKKQKITFDPNRIFTAKGREQNLKLFRSYSSTRARRLQGLSTYILKLIPDTTLVIAVHNNTDGHYSITSYNWNKILRKDAVSVHVNQDQDPDDFFITTDSTLYTELVKANYNCVLQNNKTVIDDGSLSVYFGSKNKAYINVEAQAGHEVEQSQMLSTLYQILQKE